MFLAPLCLSLVHMIVLLTPGKSTEEIVKFLSCTLFHTRRAVFMMCTIVSCPLPCSSLISNKCILMLPSSILCVHSENTRQLRKIVNIFITYFYKVPTCFQYHNSCLQWIFHLFHMLVCSIF